MLFSATMPGAVVALARRYMTQPTHIRAADTSTRVFGPPWLRRAQWALIGGMLLFCVLMVRVF